MALRTTPTARTLSAEMAFDAQVQCPNCGHAGMHCFYEVSGIPVHSCLLMPTADEALAFPRDDLRLGFCPACGFIANTIFDATWNRYSTRYEETQGFSPTFNAFARSLAQRWVERYALRGRQILEIGCGKGEFLALICQLGDNRGIGIDPSYVPSRRPGDSTLDLTFIQDLYSERYAHLPADCVICRHTLEHIAPTMEFLRMIRRTIGPRKDMLVLFELPDVARVLAEGAFWDIYYEHCSYFSAGSLARLFRASGFDVVELERAYDDQYLLIGARPADGPMPPRLPLENDLEALGEQVARFRLTVGDNIMMWRMRIHEIAVSGGRAVLWGSGSKGVAFLTTLNLPHDQIRHVVDINPHRHGKYMPGTGQPIVAPEALVDVRPTHVIVMNPIYCAEIAADLQRLGVRAELLPVSGSGVGAAYSDCP